MYRNSNNKYRYGKDKGTKAVDGGKGDAETVTTPTATALLLTLPLVEVEAYTRK